MRAGRGLARIPSLFVGLVLLATAVGKLLDVAGFAQVVESYRLVGPTASGWIAATWPVLELLAAVGLLWKPRRRAAWLAVGLHVALLAVVTFTLARGLDVPNCGCFGVFFARPLSGVTFVEDAVMLAVSLWAVRSERPR